MRTAVAVVPLALAGSLPCAAQPCPVEPVSTSSQWAGVTDAAMFDDTGQGTPRLYLSGLFTRFEGIAGARLIRRVGTAWEAVPGAPDGWSSLDVHVENGREVLLVTGPNLTIWRYDGSVWSTLPPVPVNFWLWGFHSLASFDPDGPGPLPPKLYVSVVLQDFGLGWTASWGEVYALEAGGWVQVHGTSNSGQLLAYDFDGPGPSPPALYLVGTSATCASSLPCSHTSLVQRLDGDRWTAVGSLSHFPWAARVFDPDGSGPQLPLLCVAGGFTSVTAGTTTIDAARVAAWDGDTWRTLGAGIPSAWNVTVDTLLPFDPDGPGPSPPLLIAGGNFARTTGSPGDALAAWDGVKWTEFAGGVRDSVGERASIRLLGALEPHVFGGQGQTLLASCTAILDGRVAPGIVTYRDGAWHDLLDGPGGAVYALELFNDGSGRKLFAAGAFRRCGDFTANNIARWDGAAWAPLGTGLEPTAAHASPRVFAMTVHNDGSGWALYVAGTFASAGGIPLRNIARWDGTAWSRVGSLGLSGGFVHALTVHDPDGPGPLPARLVAGGSFTWADSTPVRRLAAWDGTAWSELAGGVETSGAVRALRSFDAGDGPALYAGGDALSVGGLPPNFVAKLGAAGWQPLPDLIGAATHGRVNALAFHDAGQGYRVHAIGLHRHNRAASLGPTSWEPLTANPQCYDCAREGFAARSVIDGAGKFLYAGNVRYTSHVTGSLIQPQPGGTVHAVSPVFDDGTGDSAFLAGDFRWLAGTEPGVGAPAAHLARVRVCAPCYANCDASIAAPALNAADFSCFLQRYAIGCAAPAPCYPNCDGSTAAPFLNVADFSCFLQRFAAGCP